MQLLTVRVTNFRSADDSGSFGVEQVTCLVGKNEAGKSAILLALAALNPHPATPAVLDKERDYPRRHLTQYDVRHPKDDAIAVTTTWRLEREDLVEIAEAVGPGVGSTRVGRSARRAASTRSNLSWASSPATRSTWLFSPTRPKATSARSKS